MAKKLSIFMLIMALVFAVALTGCAPRRPVDPNAVGQGQGQGQGQGNLDRNTILGMEQRNEFVQRDFNRIGQDQTVNDTQSERVARAAQMVPGVRNATAVVNGNIAYVAVDLGGAGAGAGAGAGRATNFDTTGINQRTGLGNFNQNQGLGNMGDVGQNRTGLFGGADRGFGNMRGAGQLGVGGDLGLGNIGGPGTGTGLGGNNVGFGGAGQRGVGIDTTPGLGNMGGAGQNRAGLGGVRNTGLRDATDIGQNRPGMLGGNNAAGQNVGRTNVQNMDTIKRQVADRVRAAEPAITTVYVSADTNFMNGLRRIGTGVRDGRGVEGFTGELDRMVRRITPIRF